jgi:glutamyl-tRNA reductase
MVKGERRLVITGVNFRKTALEVRNKFSLTTENIKRIYEDIEGENPDDFFILSTCNRTEIYSITSQPEQLISLLARNGQIEEEEVRNNTYTKSGNEAIKHLFHVAAGLDSQVLGDCEIIGQLKNAYMLAKANDCISGLMEKVVNASLQASRQVRKNTSISDGTTSTSYAVIQFLRKEIGDKEAMHICLMGLGKIGTLTLKNLVHYLPQHKLTVINRNEETAQTAADEYHVGFAKIEHQDDVLQEADVLVVATGADHAIITKQQIESSKVKMLFDLSVPSNISADVKEIDGLKIYDIDMLSKIGNDTICQRKEQIPHALEIIESHIEEFKEWEKRREIYRRKALEEVVAEV